MPKKKPERQYYKEVIRRKIQGGNYSLNHPLTYSPMYSILRYLFLVNILRFHSAVSEIFYKAKARAECL